MAAKTYPHANTPWIDLSTGINPWPYPIGALSDAAFSHLPDLDEMQHLDAVARAAYQVPSAADVIACPGSDLAISMLPRMFDGTRTVGVLAPTYASHAKAWKDAGHRVMTAPSLLACSDVDIIVVVNPNNPDGRVVSREHLFETANRLENRGGVLIVDEAFADVMPDVSVVDLTEKFSSLVVLRSFGKFYGLAGLRLGFVITRNAHAQKLKTQLGDWPVSGPALSLGLRALQDEAWQVATREKLRSQAEKLDACFAERGFDVIGGTSLFRLVARPHVRQTFESLANAGILVRPFDYEPTWLRFGIPKTDEQNSRLSRALGQVLA